MSESTSTSNPILLDSLNVSHENEVPRRWCFGPNQDNTEVAGSCTLSPSSQIVQSDKPWEYQLELNNVAVGRYSLAFCVSLDKLSIDLLESFTFEAKVVDNAPREMDDSSVVRKEDVEQLPQSGRILLRRHRQLHIPNSSIHLSLIITIKTTAEPVAPLLLELHHIELATNWLRDDNDVPVYTLFGEDKPDLFIEVGDTSKYPVKICAYDVSDMGDHIATLHLKKDIVYLDIWDISRQGDEAGRPQSITAPFARHSFKLENGNESLDQNLDVAISSTGLQAAVCSLHKDGKPFVPLSIYRCEAGILAYQEQGQPWPLEKVTIAEPLLAGAFGDIVFRTIDPASNEAKYERFFKFDGVTFDVYKAKGKWRRLFSLPISNEWMPKAMMAESLFYSIRGRHFAYTGTKGLVLIWDFEASRIVSNISVPVDTWPMRATISRDGSLVAIAVKGVIRVHEVQSGVQLGCLKEGLNENNEFDMDFVQDYLTTLKYATSTAASGAQPSIRNIVRVRDMTIVGTYKVHSKYWLQTPQAKGSPIFAFEQGAILNVIKHEYHTQTEEVPDHTNCSANIDIRIREFHNKQLDLTDSHGTVFNLTASNVIATWPLVTAMHIDVKDASGSTIKKTKISMGTAHTSLQGFYLEKSSQLFILSSCYLQVWHLSATGESICDLLYIWKLDQDDPHHAEHYHYRELRTAKACEHDKIIHITLSPAQWIRHGQTLPDGVPGKNNDIVSVPISSEDTFEKMSEDMRLVGGVQHLAIVYAESDPSVQESILRYLVNCIHPSRKHPTSSLVSLCGAWSHKNGAYLKEVISKLLPFERITWIPHLTSSKGQNPLAILFSRLKQEPALSKLVIVITDYCTKHAIRTRDSSFLVPIFASMPEFMKLLPDYARDFLTDVSYIPTKRRAFILHNHIIVHPPRALLKPWRSEKTLLAKTKYPILQLNDFPSEPDHNNSAFPRPLFTASFNMLWTSSDSGTAKKDGPNTITWWKTLYYMLTLRLCLRTQTHVECHHFNLEVFDNPAIAALVAYKWNTIGFMYWAFRFTFQLIFYILVIAAALLQVYHDNIRKSQVTTVFICIIVFGMAFLWLELLQAIKHGKRYRTIYNLLDVVGFTVPVGTSIHQLVVLYENDPNGYTKTLSFTILVVALHALFELRVFKSVCKWVAIIQHTVVEIRAFIFLFAAGIVAFAIVILHLLKACPLSSVCRSRVTRFPDDFLGALSATYFFMGGKYDPVDKELESEGWEFQSVMVGYFFFTVIVMLNVLIALINLAYTKSDDSWRLVCIESRLRCIEAAENMSYDIPGFRQSHNWFPKEIFYSATLQEVRDYREKYHSKASNKNKDRDLLEDWEQDDYEDTGENQEASRTRIVGAPQNENNTFLASVNEEVEEKKKEEQEDQDEDDNEDENTVDCADDDGGDEEVVDIDRDEDEQAESQDIDTDEHALVVKDLKVQVVKLQRQVSRQLKAQQGMLEQSQKQFEELRRLLSASNRV